MSLSDPLGDLLTRIRNASRARQSRCSAPASKLRANVLDVLKREGYIRAFSTEEVRPGVAVINIELKYSEGEPVIKEITHVLHRPGVLGCGGLAVGGREGSSVHPAPREGDDPPALRRGGRSGGGHPDPGGADHQVQA
ncbi:30S ribosomal protein S8 [Leptolyngbya sp. 15MV]|nr:30S ribosomal protein S8 [Leptolyngbya sp. 15MV]